MCFSDIFSHKSSASNLVFSFCYYVHTDWMHATVCTQFNTYFLANMWRYCFYLFLCYFSDAWKLLCYHDGNN